MTWSVYADTLVNDDRSVSALVPLLVLENDRELRADHNRACGHVYPVPVVVRPPTTDGALGPLSVPVIVPRSPWLSDLRCTLTVETAEALDVTVWAAVEGGPFVRGETDSVDGVAVLEVTLPGVGAGDGWVVVRIGLTVDVETPVQVTEEGTVTASAVVFSGGTMTGDGIVLATPGVEYVMPSGRTVYIGGQDGAGVWRVWPEVDDTESPIDADTFGIQLPEVKVCAWRVDHVGAELIVDESVQDGAPLSDSDIPRQVARVRRHWRARSIWAVAGPAQDPTTDHGARGTTVTMPAVVATTDQTARIRVAVLVGRGGGGEMRARLEWDGDETEYQDLPARRGPASLIIRGVSGWTGRDLLFVPDLASYALLELDVETAPASPYIVAEDAVVRASGVSAVHVAALSIVEVPE